MGPASSAELHNGIADTAGFDDFIEQRPQVTDGSRPLSCHHANAYVDYGPQHVTLNAMLYVPETIIDDLHTAAKPSSPHAGAGGFLIFKKGGDHG